MPYRRHVSEPFFIEGTVVRSIKTEEEWEKYIESRPAPKGEDLEKLRSLLNLD